MKKITGDTLLAEFQFPYLRTVLEDVFLLPPEELSSQPLPKTIHQLCKKSGFALDDSVRRLRDLYKLSQGIMLNQITIEEIQLIEYEFLWITRHSLPKQEILDSILKSEKTYSFISEILDFQGYMDRLLEKYQNIRKTRGADTGLIILADTKKSAWSGALYLRQEGLLNCFAMTIPD